MKQYYTRSWRFKIEEVEITRKSESSVWLMYNGRERRESNTYYFDTFEEAKQSIVDREKSRLDRLHQQAESAQQDYLKALNLTP